jgi:uncharacterized coiled-coil DUF342 family protein
VEALVEREGQLHGLEERLGRLRRLAESLGQQADEYNRQLEVERAAHAETQRALLQARRELAEARRVIAGMHAQVKLLEREVHAPVWRRVFR